MMSNILTDLIGRRCTIKNDDDEYLTGDPAISCHVLAADDEWIKVAFVDREGNRVARLERMETICSVTIYDDRVL